jgi:hypothetical protein
MDADTDRTRDETWAYLERLERLASVEKDSPFNYRRAFGGGRRQ